MLAGRVLKVAAVLWQGSQLIDGQFPRHRPAVDGQRVIGLRDDTSTPAAMQSV
jgi:hypothetical protein